MGVAGWIVTADASPPSRNKQDSSTLVVSTPELRVRVHVNGRQSNFKPDPVCAFNSAREDFAVECGYVVGWYVIFVVDGFVDARERCLITSSKMFHGGRASLLSFLGSPIWNNVGSVGECKGAGRITTMAPKC